MREKVLYKVLLGTQKAYDDLDRERCLVILVGYNIGPNMERVLRFY